MQMEFRQLMIVFLVMCASVSQASTAPRSPDCQRLATAFLANPTKSTASDLQSNKGNVCWPAIESSNVNFNILLRNIQRGKYWAARYLAVNLKYTDGGNLEDSLAALGTFSDHDMEDFLGFAKEGLISKHEFSDAVTALPLSLSDNQVAQLAALKAREGKIIRVSRKDLSEQKALAIKTIEEFVAEIKRAGAGD
jgi:hypothetical protein